MSDSLNKVDKSLIAAAATMHASYLSREGNVRSVSNAAIDTTRIKTLAEYYHGDPEKLKTYDPSKLDNDKLMRTYVIPITLDNGEQIDLIVNDKGQDMACIYLDADSKEHQFQITPRMKAEIDANLKQNGINGLQTKLDYNSIKEMIEPRTLEEFTEAVEKDNLVPRNSRDTVARVKNRDEEADIQVENDEVFEVEDEENKTPEEVQEEISLEEERLKKISERVGMTLDDMKRFCKENKLTSKAVKGAIEVVNVEMLENMLDGNQLSKDGSGSVVIIKTEENDMQNRARIVNKEGKTVLDNPKYDEQMVGLVPEQPTSEPIRNLEEYTEEMNRDEDVEYTDSNGNTRTAYIEGNQVDTAEFERRYNVLEEKYKQELESLKNSNLPPEIKSELKEKMAADFYADVCTIERETGVVATTISRSALADAEEAVDENAKTQVVEGTKDVLGAAAKVGAATLATAGAVAAVGVAGTVGVGKVIGNMNVNLVDGKITNEKKEEDEHIPQHPEEHEFPEGPWDKRNNRNG